jgi:hypothetical protein
VTSPLPCVPRPRSGPDAPSPTACTRASPLKAWPRRSSGCLHRTEESLRALGEGQTAKFNKPGL